jgi:hypothetical protein
MALALYDMSVDAASRGLVLALFLSELSRLFPSIGCNISSCQENNLILTIAYKR